MEINRDMTANTTPGPVQHLDPAWRCWEYDDDGTKIYKVTEGYNKKTPYTHKHYWSVHFWKGRG